jgi:hypothetical protein
VDPRTARERLTAWPSARLPESGVGKGAYVVLDSGLIQAWPEIRGKPQPLPAETYLRELLDLDAADPQAVTAFLNEFGMLEHPDGVTPWQRMSQQLGSPAPAPYDQSDRAVAGLAEPLRTTDAILVEYQPEYLRRKLALAQGLVRYWLWAQGALHTSPVKVWEEVDIPCADAGEARTIFEQEFERGLRVFGPRVVLGGVRSDVTLYQALCAQLYNAIEEGLPVRVCGNERCQRFFIRQRGRSGGEITRTKGTVYCSRSCGQAQKQRQYSERKRPQ